MEEGSMTPPVLERYRTPIIIALVALLGLIAFWIRMLPAGQIGSQEILTFVGSDDPIYNLRQVELMLANFPTYAWWEPMTQFPYGTDLYWGPLTTYLAAILCLLLGASTRPEIIYACLSVPPLLAGVMVPVVYLIGQRVSDWKGGLVAAGLVTIVSGQYFYRSLFGYFDHHMTEALVSAIFCLVYIWALRYVLDGKVSLEDRSSLKRPALLGLVAGIAYFVGLVAMPTMILFAMIVAIYTLVQVLYNVYRDHSSDGLLVINTVTFAVALVLLLLFGLKNTGIDLSAYTVGHVIAYLGLIAGTAILWGLARYLRGRPFVHFLGALAGLGIVIGAVLFVAVPDLYNVLIGSFGAFFGQYDVTNTVQEARGWSLGSAWSTFQLGLLLMFGGLGVLAYRFWRGHRGDHLFVLVWSVVILVSTIQHIRYEYYLAVNIALLGGIVVSQAVEIGWKDLATMLGLGRRERREDPAPPAAGPSPRAGKKSKKAAARQATGKQRASAAHPSFNLVGVSVLIGTLLVTIFFAYLSALPLDLDGDGQYDFTTSYATANLAVNRMNGDWKESLEWMRANTPPTGMDMKKVYEKKGFSYPDQAYGVMSWWDYGHLITYIAERIPNANPFQQGVSGPNGSAAYFISTDESVSNRILDNLKTRYVVTDIEMAVSKFWAMTTWYNTSAQMAPYQMTMYARNQQNPNVYDPVSVNRQEYYLTTIARLHNFDGSETAPTTAYYIEYQDPAKAKTSLPLITRAETMNGTGAAQRAAEYNARAPEGTHAIAAGIQPNQPVETVPALGHYRLIHESPSSAGTAGLKYVKVFEYVPGARIRGEGQIEVPVVTNTNRTFTWRATAVDGEFVVPYATGGNEGVHTTGPYRIVGTGQTITVPESAVLTGATV
ncbi:MAG TPA: oligosaccharyl transferase, archaeosortase A system-associated [Methanoregulaceae archaeon]|nr:oligosaccharyl transferase, archaeosortase A system-associated [Methanoregulaceae archaeon]